MVRTLRSAESIQTWPLILKPALISWLSSIMPAMVSARLIIIDDVDVHTPIESEAEQIVLSHVIRRADKKIYLDMHHEIRAIQADPEANSLSGKIKWFVLLPGFIGRLF